MKTELYIHEEDLKLTKEVLHNTKGLACGCTKHATDGEGFVLTIEHIRPADLYYFGLKVANQQSINGLDNLIENFKK